MMPPTNFNNETIILKNNYALFFADGIHYRFKMRRRRPPFFVFSSIHSWELD